MSDAALQDADAGRLVQSWVATMMETTPAQRDVVEGAVVLLYRSLGLQPPRAVWAQGPLELSRLREEGWRLHSVGDNITPLLSDKLSLASCSYSNEIRNDLVAHRRSALVATSVGLHNALMAVVEAEVSRADKRRLRRFFYQLMGRRKPRLWLTMTVGGRSQFDAPWFNCDAHLFRRYGLVPDLVPILSALSTIVSNSGWFVPHEHACWICERPEVLNIDPGVRLHSSNGPALRYRDGLEFYAWKGVIVPAWIINSPEAITVGRIARERDPFVRRCMIEVMTPARFIASGGARITSRDDAGTLWAFASGLDTWAAVEVVNGTPEADGSRKHYYLQVPPEMRSARQAVAWTYGLSEAEYAGLGVRT